MVNFEFIPVDDVRLSPAHKAQFLHVGQLIKWTYQDKSGIYSGLVVVGEKAIPQGFQSFADVTIDVGKQEIPMSKVQELSHIVQTEFQRRGVIKLTEPGKA